MRCKCIKLVQPDIAQVASLNRAWLHTQHKMTRSELNPLTQLRPMSWRKLVLDESAIHACNQWHVWFTHDQTGLYSALCPCLFAQHLSVRMSIPANGSESLAELTEMCQAQIKELVSQSCNLAKLVNKGAYVHMLTLCTTVAAKDAIINHCT